MKTIFTSIFLLALVLISLVPATSFASSADTVIVSALPPGNVNNFINSDTVSGGFSKPNTVYLLKPTGNLDTVYYITAPISVKGNCNIVGYINPQTGHPPVLAPSIAADNSSIGNFFSPQGNDTLSFKGLYFIGTRTDGVSFTGRFVSAAGGNNVFIVDHCIFENISGSGTPNLFDAWNLDHNSFYVTNCVFRNNQDDNPQNPGFAWVDPGTTPCDTAIFKNNTFFIQPYIMGSSGYGATYLEFDHNTIFLSAGGGSFVIYQLHNAVITNNIFYGVWATAYPLAWYAAGGWGSGVIALDSLTTLKADPWDMKESDRHVSITNNAYFWPKAMVDNWTKLNAGVMASNPLRQPDFINTQPGMLTDKTTWPYINVVSNDSTDPVFNSTLLQLALGQMITFVDTCWASGGTGQGFRPYVYPVSDPPTWDGLAANWSTTQGYPVPENLRYSNTALQHAGTDGKALGDLNWFPEQLISGIVREPNSTPTKFALNQNYPNPFNPSTIISYALPTSGAISLKIYNILGQEVATVFEGYQKAGAYQANFDASKLASGVYIYKLQAGQFEEAKKMMLMK